MLIARWQVEARFGYKQKAPELFKRWGEQVGWSDHEALMLTDSIGAKEAVVQSEMEQDKARGTLDDLRPRATSKEQN